MTGKLLSGVFGSSEMDHFDKSMALDVIEDALTALGAPENRGYALGLCGAFYLCGLLTDAEWEGFLARIAETRRTNFKGVSH